MADLTLERDDITRIKKTTRSLKYLTFEQLASELDFSFTDDCSLQELVACFEDESRRCLDKLAPTKTRLVTERKNEPCL